MLAAADELIRFTKRMESAGMPTHQAQEQSAAIIDLVSSLHNSNKAVTQDDLFRVKVGLQDDLFKVKVELEAKAEANKTEMLKWLFITVGSQTVVLLAALYGLITHTH